MVIHVTQVAEAAVKTQSTKLENRPEFALKGSQSKAAPTIIIMKKPRARVLAGFIDLVFFLSTGISYPSFCSADVSVCNVIGSRLSILPIPCDCA